jgi:hypothetical protein
MKTCGQSSGANPAEDLNTANHIDNLRWFFARVSLGVCFLQISSLKAEPGPVDGQVAMTRGE